MSDVTTHTATGTHDVQRQPLQPFESVSADFFTIAGKSFLVIADGLSE